MNSPAAYWIVTRYLALVNPANFLQSVPRLEFGMERTPPAGLRMRTRDPERKSCPVERAGPLQS
jgi:hypothetical protein